MDLESEIGNLQAAVRHEQRKVEKQQEEMEHAKKTIEELGATIYSIRSLVETIGEGDGTLDMVKDLVHRYRALSHVVLKLGGYEQ